VIALDTNILVYARREETKPHRAARTLLAELAEGDRDFARFPAIRTRNPFSA
jgi:predicted nucleic acid-binding protein